MASSSADDKKKQDEYLQRANSEDNGSIVSIVDGKYHVESIYGQRQTLLNKLLPSL